MSEVLIKPFYEEDKTISDVFIEDKHILNKCLDNIKKYKYLSANNNFFEYDIEDNLFNELSNFYKSLNGNKKYIDDIRKGLKVLSLYKSTDLKTALKSDLIHYIQNEQNNQINLLEIYLHIIFFYKEALNNKAYSYKENDIYKYFQYVYLKLDDFSKFNFNDFITNKDSFDEDNLHFIQTLFVKFLEVAYIETLYSQPIYSILSINKLRNENIKIIDFKPLYEIFMKYNSRNKEIENLFKQYDIDIYRYINKNNIFYNIKISDDSDVIISDNSYSFNIKECKEQILKFVQSNISFDDNKEIKECNNQILQLEEEINTLQQNSQNREIISQKESLQQQINKCNDVIITLKKEIKLILNPIKQILMNQNKQVKQHKQLRNIEIIINKINNIIKKLEDDVLFDKNDIIVLSTLKSYEIPDIQILKLKNNCNKFNTTIKNKSDLELQLSALSISDLEYKLTQLDELKKSKEKIINNLQSQEASKIYNNLKTKIKEKIIKNTPQDNKNISFILDAKNKKLLDVFSICDDNTLLNLQDINEKDYFDYMLKIIINNKIMLNNNIFINRFIMNIYSIYKYYKNGMILSDNKNIYIPIPKLQSIILNYMTHDGKYIKEAYNFSNGQNEYINFKEHMVLFNSITSNFKKNTDNIDNIITKLNKINQSRKTLSFVQGGKNKFDFAYNYDQLLFQISYYLKCIIKNDIIKIESIINPIHIINYECNYKDKSDNNHTYFISFKGNEIEFKYKDIKIILLKNNLEYSLYDHLNRCDDIIKAYKQLKNKLNLKMIKNGITSSDKSYVKYTERIKQCNNEIKNNNLIIQLLCDFYNKYIIKNMTIFNYKDICDYVGSLSLFNNQYNQPISVSNYRNIFNIDINTFQSFIININDYKYNIPLHKIYPSKYMIYLLKNTDNITLYKNILLSNITDIILFDENNLEYIYKYTKPCLIDDQSNCYEIGSNEYNSYNEIIKTSKTLSKKRQRGNTDDESALKQSTKEETKRFRHVVDSDDEEEDKDDILDVSSIINDKVVIIILRDNKYDYNSKLNMTLISSNYTDYEIRIPLNVQFQIDPKKLNYVFVYYNDTLQSYDCVYILSVDINNETNKISMNGNINQKYIDNLNNFDFSTDSIMLNKKDESVDSDDSKMNGGKYKTLNKKYYYYLNKYNLI